MNCGMWSHFTSAQFTWNWPEFNSGPLSNIFTVNSPPPEPPESNYGHNMMASGFAADLPLSYFSLKSFHFFTVVKNIHFKGPESLK